MRSGNSSYSNSCAALGTHKQGFPSSQLPPPLQLSFSGEVAGWTTPPASLAASLGVTHLALAVLHGFAPPCPATGTTGTMGTMGTTGTTGRGSRLRPTQGSCWGWPRVAGQVWAEVAKHLLASQRCEVTAAISGWESAGE